MAALSEWLQLMLGEIARKKEDGERARAEEAQRASEEGISTTVPSNVTSVQEARAARR